MRGIFCQYLRYYLISLEFKITKMAAIAIGLCAATMKIAAIWDGAMKVKGAIDSYNPITLVQERHIVNAARQVIAYEIEIYTSNGFEYFFCIDVRDPDIRQIVLQTFVKGKSVNRAVCDAARAQMAAHGINHRFYLDPSHAGGKRIFILMSGDPNRRLNVFMKPHWKPML
jgi:hypothetical protein